MKSFEKKFDKPGANHRNGHADKLLSQVLNAQSEVDDELLDLLGDQHLSSSLETPMRDDAFRLNDEEKVLKIAAHFREIMETLGLDLTDDSLQGTPMRVAKMYVKEIFSGLNPANKPEVRLFDNKYGYGQMLLEKDISFYSNCEHHFVPIFGKAHVAYFSTGQVVGLSKLNRIVQYYGRRPQVQERMTRQIAEEIRSSLNTPDVAVILDANHMCVCSRGVKDISSSTITAEYLGKFQDPNVKMEFLKYLEISK